MSFLLDNLTASVVGAILLGSLLVLQQRDQHDAIEAVQIHRAQVMAATLISTLEREVENARGRDETERVFSTATGGTPLGPDEYRFRLIRDTTSDGTVFTRHLSFPTLLDPDRLTDSPLGIVTYHVQETPKVVNVDGRPRRLLQVTRYEFERGQPIRSTVFFDRLVDFDVTAFEPNGTQVLTRLEMAETPQRIHIDLRYAPDILSNQGGDEDANMVYSTRHARTVRIPAATAYERFGDAPPTGPGGIPTLPGEEDDDSPSGTPGTVPGTTPDGEARISVCHRDAHGGQATLTGTLTELEHHRTHSGDSLGPCPTSGGGTTPGGEDRISICHRDASGRQATLTGTLAELEYHRTHPNDALGACR